MKTECNLLYKSVLNTINQLDFYYVVVPNLEFNKFMLVSICRASYELN